jgi:hypothetical protein
MFSCFALSDSFWAVPRALGVHFSCFALTYSFSAVPWVLGRVFMFCVPVLVFGDTVRAGFHFHVLRSQTRSGGGNVGVGSLFFVLRSRAHVRQYHGHRVLISCFALLTHVGW